LELLRRSNSAINGDKVWKQLENDSNLYANKNRQTNPITIHKQTEPNHKQLTVVPCLGHKTNPALHKTRPQMVPNKLPSTRPSLKPYKEPFLLIRPKKLRHPTLSHKRPIPQQLDKIITLLIRHPRNQSRQAREPRQEK